MIRQEVVKQSFATNPAAGTRTVAFDTEQDTDGEIVAAFKDASISSSNDSVESESSKSSIDSSSSDNSD